MRSYISYDELEELGETIVRAYINKTRRYNALCVDIEGLVTDYLGLTVVYETIVEDDLNKIAFLSNGKRPLRVVRDGKRVEVESQKTQRCSTRYCSMKERAAAVDSRLVTKAHTASSPSRTQCRMWDAFITHSIPRDNTLWKNAENCFPSQKRKRTDSLLYS